MGEKLRRRRLQRRSRLHRNAATPGGTKPGAATFVYLSKTPYKGTDLHAPAKRRFSCGRPGPRLSLGLECLRPIVMGGSQRSWTCPGLRVAISSPKVGVEVGFVSSVRGL
eukprot:3280803-Rhodomonas_salina.1